MAAEKLLPKWCAPGGLWLFPFWTEWGDQQSVPCTANSMEPESWRVQCLRDQSLDWSIWRQPIQRFDGRPSRKCVRREDWMEWPGDSRQPQPQPANARIPAAKFRAYLIIYLKALEMLIQYNETKQVHTNKWISKVSVQLFFPFYLSFFVPMIFLNCLDFYVNNFSAQPEGNENNI